MFYVCVQRKAHTRHGAHMEVRGELTGAGSLYCVDPGISLGSTYPYQLGQLGRPTFLFSFTEQVLSHYLLCNETGKRSLHSNRECCNIGNGWMPCCGNL